MRVFEKVASLTAAAANGEGTPVNVALWKSGCIAVTITGVTACNFKASPDGLTWHDIYGQDLTSSTLALVKAVTTTGKLVQFRDLGGIQFLRCDVSNAGNNSAVTAVVTGNG
jgi:hypothetical protein